MARTTRRQTFNVPTSSSNYSKPQFFNQVEFKGLCTNQNDVTIDPQSFSDVRNMLVDENGVLVSRPPVKFVDGESNIIDERQFGLYRIRLYRLCKEYDGISYFVFLLRCVSHNTIEDDEQDKFSQYSWWIPTNLIDDKEMPKISYAHIEDKVFIWFAGIDFIVLNTVGLMMNGEKYLYFEDATKYLYTPVHKLISNGIEGELEGKNFFNSSYYERYQYSLVSNIDFAKLSGASVDVKFNGISGSQHLYDLIVDDVNPDLTREILLYPHSVAGSSEDVDIVVTDRADVILKYNQSNHAISVSFGDEYFRSIPRLPEIYGNFIGSPILTKDGMHIVAYTKTHRHICPLVMQGMSEPVDVFEWNTTELSYEVRDVIGYFDTIDTYAVLLKCIYSGYAESWYCFWAQNGYEASMSLTNNPAYVIPNYSGSDELNLATYANGQEKNIVIAYRGGNQIYICEINSEYIMGGVSHQFMSSRQLGTYSSNPRNWDFLMTFTHLFIAGNIEEQDVLFTFTKENHYIENDATEVRQSTKSSSYKVSEHGYMTESYVYDGKRVDLPRIANSDAYKPLYRSNNSNWYLVGDEIWTTALRENTMLELDVLITNETVVIPPDHHATMNTNYFAYETPNGEYLLEATETRRDNGTLLLYAPSINEQKFTGKITALHPLSDSQMGIFTNDGIWYISMIQNDDGLILYSQPIRSKLPVKLRDGDEVVTALDGQALIFPTTRGIVALAPQDFIATTEKTINYITDIMQEKYRRFYDDEIMNANLYYTGSGNIPFDGMHRPEIKICTYNYWLLFYKYLDTEILALDTRSGSWWSWSVQYPIRSITADEQLHLLLQIDYNPKSVSQSLAGVSFVLTNQDVSYNDDVVNNTLTGKYSIIHDNDYMDDTFVLHSVSSDINWYFTSQRLGFGQINNYKAIRAINMNLRGDDVNAKLYTKAYRDVYHPEQEDVVEIKINELRTFVKRFNLMHILDFQYRIENDKEVEIPHQFQLNSLSLKYEVKEGVR